MSFKISIKLAYLLCFHLIGLFLKTIASGILSLPIERIKTFSYLTRFQIKDNLLFANQKPKPQLSSFYNQPCSIDNHLHLYNDWDAFFPDSTVDFFQNYTSYTGDENKLTLSNNAWIVNCYFHDMSSANNGSAIYMGTNIYDILIEYCTFQHLSISSTSNIYGGAIRIFCGNIVLNQICGYNCQSSYNNGFSDIYAYDTSINTILQTSVSHSSANNSITMYNYLGFINVSAMNLSYNEVKNYSSAIDCYPSKTKTVNGNTLATSITYSSFANNTATNYFCIALRSDFSSAYNYAITNSNIIRNKRDQTIYSYGTTTMTDCCIRENDVTSYDFYIRSGYTITLKNCSVDNTNYNNEGTLEIMNCDKTFYWFLQFLSTEFCPAEQVKIVFQATKCTPHPQYKPYAPIGNYILI